MMIQQFFRELLHFYPSSAMKTYFYTLFYLKKDMKYLFINKHNHICEVFGWF